MYVGLKHGLGLPIIFRWRYIHWHYHCPL